MPLLHLQIKPTLDGEAYYRRCLGILNEVQLEFTVGDDVRRVAVKSIFSVTGPESYLAGGRLGLGLVQVPRFHVQNDLTSGSMLEVLGNWPPPMVPVSLLYPRNRQLSARVRVFLDWAAREFAARNVNPA